MSEHTWYPENNPLEGDPNSGDVLAILASLHSDHESSAPFSDRYLTADDVKAIRHGE